MTDIYRYVIVDAADQTIIDWEYDDFVEATIEAERLNGIGTPCAVVQRTFSYTDSELVWAPNQETVWPPTLEPV